MGNICGTGSGSIGSGGEEDYIRRILIGDSEYGGKEEGFWESNELEEALGEKPGIEYFFFLSLALGNRVMVRSDPYGSDENAKSVEYNYTDRNCINAARRAGMRLSGYSTEKLVKEVTFNLDLYGKEVESWRELQVFEITPKRQRISVVCEEVEVSGEDVKPKGGDIYVFSHGTEKGMSGKILSEKSKKRMEACKKFDRRCSKEVKKKTAKPYTSYVAYKKISRKRYDKIEGKYMDGEQTEDRKLEGALEGKHARGGKTAQNRFKMEEALESGMTLLGCVRIPANDSL